MRKILTNEILEKMKKDYHNGMGLVELSNKYDFQEQTIQKHFRNIGITIAKGNSKRFTEQEINDIVQDYKNGMKPYELAKKYRRDSGTIIWKLQSIGVYEFAKHRFTDEEIEFLKIYYPKGDWETINKKFPNISKQSIHTKMSKIGLSMDSYYWSKDDEQILIDNYESMYGHIDELVKLFDEKYTYKAIVSKARKLGLKSRELWTDEEISILKNHYSIKTLDELFIMLPKRNRHTITEKARSFNLVNKIKLDCQYNENEKEFIFKKYNIMTDREIAEKLNRKTHNISDFRYKNNLLKIYEKSSYENIAEFVRRNNIDWKKESMKQCNYKCVLSGKRFDEIHHIYSFNFILNEAFEKSGLYIKEDINDYSKQELMTFLNCFREIQSNYPLGICLTKEIHALFHKIYGYGNNTIEQWNNFVSEYNNGNYNNILNVA